MKSIILFSILLLLSCNYDQMENLEVESFSPTSGYNSNTQDVSIKIIFNQTCSIKSIESNFSLTANGEIVDGDFVWSNSNRTVEFLPFDKFEIDKKYKLSITTGAEDEVGNSLKKEFVNIFYFNTDEIRPTVLSISPYNKKNEIEAFNPVTILFSEPIDIDTFLSSFSITPEIEKVLTCNSEYTEFNITPTREYSWNVEYTIKLGKSITDLNMNSLAEEYISYFTRSSDKSSLEITNLTTLKDKFTIIEDSLIDETITVTDGIENNEQFEIQFSRDVNFNEIESYIYFTPQIPYQIENKKDTQGKNVILKPLENFNYNKTYTITISKDLHDIYGTTLESNHKYNILINGENSEPPMFPIEKISFYNTEKALNSLLEPFSQFPDESMVINTEYFTYIDFTLIPSRNLTVDENIIKRNFLNNVSISTTNSCSDITILGCELNPYPPINSNEILLRLYINYTPKNNSGNISISISSDFNDGRNSLEENINLTYNRIP
ncbi:MAG: Ig-like domain-containing protein [Spirochaetales bacterium]|nr:Ig-like domain-containing protein [Spirochaetales bacterium]